MDALDRKREKFVLEGSGLQYSNVDIPAGSGMKSLGEKMTPIILGIEI